MARPRKPLTAKAENYIRAYARGEDYWDIMKDIFGLEPGCDPKERNRADQQMYRWRRRPEFKAIWEDELSATVRRRLPGALSKIIAQVDNQNDWIANKAANDLLTLAKTVGIVSSEETAVKVQFEGMPEIGTPDGD